MQFDLWLLHLINGINNQGIDVLAMFCRNPFAWGPVYAGMMGAIWIKFPNYGAAVFAILGVVLCFAISDFFSAQIIKPYFHRLRPCNDVQVSSSLRHLVQCGSGFSFTSNHASNHFALSTYLSVVLGRKAWQIALLYFWALLVVFSQVHVGVHYPSDVAAGAGFGSCLGLGIGLLAKSYIKT